MLAPGAWREAAVPGASFMPISHAIQPITADDEALSDALADAFLPALLPALAQATGDLSLLRDDLRPNGAAFGAEQGGMTAEQQDAARALALAALKTLRDAGDRSENPPATETLRRIIDWMTGSAARDEYIPLLIEELAPNGTDGRAPAWRMDPARPFLVAVIGAGMSGILAAIRLKQAGVPCVILEKNHDVGGTWLENTYPGARVDVSNAFYSYSFAQRGDWPKHFSPQDVLLDYFRECADAYGIRDAIRFNTEVVEARWDEARLQWALTLRTPNGEETIAANALVSAVGQLNRPKMPDIPGMESFAGPAFHSARWNHNVDLRGKRVAVIGTGASAAQFAPAIAEPTAELTIFQRTPNWFFAVPTYHDDVPEGQRWLFAHVPHYVQWNRFWLFWTTTDGLLPAAHADAAWQPQDRSVSAANDELRALLTAYLQSEYADRPDLFEKVLPAYPPAAKRIVLDNGSWARMLKRDNVKLETQKIERITAAGVVTADGREHPADVIIYGTGFQASSFLTPMRVLGRDGADLHEQWDGDARAYLGIMVPRFPNFFMLYGPNTNIVVNGSIIYFSECEVQYVLGCLQMLLASGSAAIDCKQDVHDAYNERIDAANRERVWGVATVNSWYRNARGRVAQNWPFNLIEYWQQTRRPNRADYDFLGESRVHSGAAAG
jgi:4-hydroxyacetophenone monooxygenase